MKFYEIVEQVLTLLQREGRVSYRALKREFDLDDEYIADLGEELVVARRVAVDEDGRVLVWLGASPVQSSECKVPSSTQPPLPNTQHPEAERRQLTVMFCDLVGSTALSEQLDPEELREVVRAYQETGTDVIRRYDGHIAQHLGDGLLVYFGYPAAHEDDAARAVRTGLEIITALHEQVPSPLGEQASSQHAARMAAPPEGQGEGGKNSAVHTPHPNSFDQAQDRLPPQGGKEKSLQVRIGIHTGLVVIGEIGGSEKREILALGETPNIAARIQGLAEPDTMVMSAATYRLVEGLFDCDALGPQTLKGISAPLAVYRVVEESDIQSRFDATVRAGLTPLVGREEELGLLHVRWERAKAGHGQVILLSGEPGIGKSRLVQALKEQVLTEGATRIEFRCSPYHQNSAFHPIVEHLQRLLQLAPHETPQAKLAKLQQALAAYRFPQADTFPLLAALLSLPQPEDVPALTLSPQKQKQKTQDALVAWIVEEAEKAAVYCAWEDLHWADPSTLDVLTLFLDQVPTTRLLALLTFRPGFTPSWSPRSYLTQLTLSRLERPYVEAMVEQVMSGKALPSEVLQQIVAKTDGVPLFVEELTKTVLESGLLREEDGRYVGAHGGAPIPPLAIPSTLQDSLMARLDRLAPVREIAQVGATLGREFSYELLHTVFPSDEETLQQGLRQLVEAELIYQRGLPPQATYLFKHALIQDTAYQSLLKSKRQQLHQQVAQVLADRFPETVETQPELLAHHYTEASLLVQAIPYWQSAGQKASRRSAHREAISHLTKGLELLKTLPDTHERGQHELTLQITLGASLLATKGFAAPEAGAAYTRARELCQQGGNPSQPFFVLMGLRIFYLVRGEVQVAREIGEQFLRLAQPTAEPAFLLEAHYALGVPLTLLGEFASARGHLEQSATLYDPRQHHSHAFLYGLDPGVTSLTYAPLSLWALGYPDQALEMSRRGLALARELSHPHSLAFALIFAALLHHLRREEQTVQELAEAALALSREQGFALWLAVGTILQGGAVAERGQRAEGIVLLRQGLAAWRATGAEGYRTGYLLSLAEACGKAGQAEEGLMVIAEAFAMVEKTGERWREAELYRLRGELALAQSRVQSLGSSVTNPQSLTPKPLIEAEACFLKAVEIARKQQAKSLELRATVSLARLWQQQGKQHQACDTLAAIYNWFTEGFDTKDLQEAKMLLNELGH
jgi:class 3 adenylate cyclase/predicted ATPase